MKNVLYRGIKYILRQVMAGVRYKITQFMWIKKNTHNKTRMGNYFPLEKVSVGRYTYGQLNVHHFDAQNEGLIIGDFVSIGPNVEFFLGGEHHPKYISNYPFALYMDKCAMYSKEDITTKGPIKVDDDVWLGAHVLVMSGVHIGRGAIIGAGSVVTKDIPPYAIFAGGKIVKYRFDEHMINKLLMLDYSKVDEKFLEQNVELFYSYDIEKALKRIPFYN